ncbi:hypothetical protein [Rhodococcus triatomae]|nr:phage protein [Rhodococcus triatomae BKS 15-14]
MATPETLPLLDDAYARTVREVRARVTEFVVSRFGPAAIGDAGLSAFLTEILPTVLAGRRQIAALTDAYLAERLSVSLARTVLPQGVIDTAALRGIDPAEEYTRPTVSTRTALSQDATVEQAVAAGVHRLVDLVATDMQLAKTHQAKAVLSRTRGVQGYRRVLNGSENCALCLIASTQRYSVGSLMPIHPGCDCGIAEIVSDADMAGSDELLERVHDSIQAQLGISNRDGRTDLDYKELLVVQEHGEIGPILTLERQNFTGPADLPR